MGWVIPLAMAAAAGYLSYKSSKGSDKEKADQFTPDMEELDRYKKAQDVLFPFGTDLLSGKVPSAYSSLIENNSPEFQSMLSLVNRDTAKAVDENLTRRNISRSGLGAVATAKSMAGVGSKLRWDDFLRTTENMKYLLSLGTNVISDVKNSALTAQNLTLGIDKVNYMKDLYNKQIEARQRNAWATALGSAVNTFTNLYGASQLGRGNAAGSAAIGSSYTPSYSAGSGAWGMEQTIAQRYSPTVSGGIFDNIRLLS